MSIVINKATQKALLGDDNSITNLFVAIATLVGMDILFSLWKKRSPPTENLLDGVPLVLVKDGQPCVTECSKLV
ncbi:hypothetical protein H6G17_26345 [Chroococcidiopsis sp. FACHB-1243]|uniref:hypothetical protein n=1 Tax=Chroococcidiopsis sp. [FACHB-1243] TaxID=2692781 RepID=UPI00177EADCB|nr:hypothetical protein [Chroococcidiopsis sp. [FACHB-1243]]MBD2308989.1 hypothetical protein [Chroococcidiopsis sp. [FACHB-1243]]